MNDKVRERKHNPQLSRKIFAMRQVRDCVEGSDAVKRANELYLPIPDGMVDLEISVVEQNLNRSNNQQLDNRQHLNIQYAPWYHSIKPYMAYLQRARFPDITGNTLRGMVGICTREEADITPPSGHEYIVELATRDGVDIYEVFKHVVTELFVVGRHAIVLDVRNDNKFYFSCYKSENYVNWDFDIIDDERVQTYAEFEMNVDTADGVETHRMCYSLEAFEEQGKPVVVYRKYVDDQPVKVDGENTYLVMEHQGTKFDRLPIQNFGAIQNTPDIDTSPLLGISDCALAMYRTSADLKQGQFHTCNPTLVLIGVDPDDAPKRIGSPLAICLEDPSSNAMYLQTDAAGLTHLQTDIKETAQEAVSYGVQMLGSRHGVESAEALAIQKAQKNATLSSIVDNAEDGFNGLFAMMARFGGGSEGEFIANKEFAEQDLSPQEMSELLKAMMSGAMSKLTYLENLSAAGYLRGRTPDEEIDAIENETLDAPPLVAAPPAQPMKQEEQEAEDE